MFRQDIFVTDTVFGLISGFCFVLFYALLGVPIAALADRVSRRNVIAAGFALWTIMTMATGMVTSALQLALTRFLIGAGEACAGAPSNAMINDIFTQHMRRRALSIFFAVSSAASSMLLIPIAGMASAAYGWRAVFIGSGLAGLLLAAIFLLTVKEPPRRDQAPGLTQTTFFDFSFVSLPFILLVCSSALNGAHINAANAWSSIFLNRVHAMEVKEIAVTLGPFKGMLSAFGILLGGYLADRLTRVDRRWRMWFPALTCLLVTPSSVLFLFGEQRWVWMTGLGLDSLLLLTHMAPVYALAMELAGPHRRALALSILMFASSLIGSGIGPLMVGFLNDHVVAGYGAEGVRYSLMAAGIFPSIAALMLFGAGYLLETRERAAIASGETVNAP